MGKNRYYTMDLRHPEDISVPFDVTETVEKDELTNHPMLASIHAHGEQLAKDCSGLLIRGKPNG